MDNFSAEWYDDGKTIIHVHYPTKFTVRQLSEWVNSDLIALFDAVDHPVFMLTNGNNTLVPTDVIASLTQLKRAWKFLQHPNYTGQVFYNVPSGLGRFTLQLWTQLFDKRSHIADTQASALEKIEALRIQE